MRLNRLRVFVLVGVAAAFGQVEKQAEQKVVPSQGKAPATVRKPGPSTAKPQPTIPPDAKEIEPGVFSHTDSQGKKWLYYKTPFGIAKRENRPATAEETSRAQAAEEETLAQITGTEDGDYVRFERRGPFGQYRWRQKKTELTGTEQKAWERSKKKAPEEKAK